MIPFIDLKAQRDRIEPGMRQRIDCVLEHCAFIMGPEVAELEIRLAEYSSARHAIACSSGTDALLLALMAHGVKPGDAVFTTPFTFIATVEVISLLGATPVFVDIDPLTCNMSVEELQRSLATFAQDERFAHLQPRGIIVVDLYGLPADYPAINALAEEYGLFVLQDAAQSFGGAIHGRRSGSLAHAAGTSFFPAKPLGCYGDGGAVFTDDTAFADILSSLRVHGKGAHKYDNARIGLNARLDTIQAAVLLAKMDVFEEEIELRASIAARYNDMLGHLEGVQLPHVPEGHASAWAQYTIRIADRDRVQQELKQAGVPSVVYFPTPMHLQKAFSYLGCKVGDYPQSESAASDVLSLPMYPYLPEEHQDKVVRELQRIIG